MAEIERIVVVTKKTALEDLVYRMNSRDQARFYLEQNQVSFSEYEQADAHYQRALDEIRCQLPRGLKQQFIERDFLPTYQFDEHDLVVTVGPDGLVINTAKYLSTQPILALNPDPQRVDGILIPFRYDEAGRWIEQTRAGRVRIARVSMVKAALNDGQELYAVNDLFIGPRSHGSARYTLKLGRFKEVQSSSGIIVSTGAGCTGWLSSIVTGAWHVARYFERATSAGSKKTGYANTHAKPPTQEELGLGWESETLWFTVREPFVSRTSQASLVFGQIKSGDAMVITSHMPDYGVIFSDGIESDYLSFNSGAIAKVSVAERKAHLVMKPA